jgi:hypothetical protein
LQVANRSFGGDAFGLTDGPGRALLSIQALHSGP